MLFDNLPKDAIMPHPFKEHWKQKKFSVCFDYQRGHFKNYDHGGCIDK